MPEHKYNPFSPEIVQAEADAHAMKPTMDALLSREAKGEVIDLGARTEIIKTAEEVAELSHTNQLVNKEALVLAGTKSLEKSGSPLERYLRKVEFVPEAAVRLEEFNRGTRIKRWWTRKEKIVPAPYQYDLQIIEDLIYVAGNALVRQAAIELPKLQTDDVHRDRTLAFLNDAGGILSRGVVDAARQTAGNLIMSGSVALTEPITFNNARGAQTNRLTGAPSHFSRIAVECVWGVTHAIENVGRGQFEAALNFLTHIQNGIIEFTPENLTFLTDVTSAARYDKAHQESIKKLDDTLRTLGVIYNDTEDCYENTTPGVVFQSTDRGFKEIKKN